MIMLNNVNDSTKFLESFSEAEWFGDIMEGFPGASGSDNSY